MLKNGSSVYLLLWLIHIQEILLTQEIQVWLEQLFELIVFFFFLSIIVTTLNMLSLFMNLLLFRVLVINCFFFVRHTYILVE